MNNHDIKWAGAMTAALELGELSSKEMIGLFASGDPRGIESWLASGGNVDAKNEVGDSLLIRAVRFGYLPIVQVLVDAGANVNTQGHDGITALIKAVRYGNISIIKYLKSAGADIDIKDDSQRTALMIAATRGNVEVVEALLNIGADINSLNKEGKTALGLVREVISTLSKEPTLSLYRRIEGILQAATVAVAAPGAAAAAAAPAPAPAPAADAVLAASEDIGKVDAGPLELREKGEKEDSKGKLGWLESSSSYLGGVAAILWRGLPASSLPPTAVTAIGVALVATGLATITLSNSSAMKEVFGEKRDIAQAR